MKEKAFLGHNKYEVVRGMWKRIMLAALTFANAILCFKSDMLSGLEVIQGSIGQLALAAYGKATNEAAQGDTGWTSFEVKETQVKIGFDDRLSNDDQNKWAAKVNNYLNLKSMDRESSDRK